MTEKFKQAFSYHKEGKLTPARDLYMEILTENSQNHEVWDLLGLLYYQASDYLEAEACIKKLLQLSLKYTITKTLPECIYRKVILKLQSVCMKN